MESVVGQVEEGLDQVETPPGGDLLVAQVLVRLGGGDRFTQGFSFIYNLRTRADNFDFLVYLDQKGLIVKYLQIIGIRIK